MESTVLRVKHGISYHLKKSQMRLASGTGNTGWSRTQPELVCCEATQQQAKHNKV